MKNVGIYRNPGLFIALLNDLAPSMETERKLLRTVFSTGELSGLADILKKSETERNLELKKLSYNIVNNYFMNQEKVDEALQ